MPAAEAAVRAQAGAAPRLSEAAHARVRAWFKEATGVSMARMKAPLVAGRLAKRLRVLGLDGYEAYVDEIASGRNPAEAAIAIDLLTTHETRFFREPAHFTLLEELLRGELAQVRAPRIWSAACSTGEEAWSIAMKLADARHDDWEVLATDVSAGVLERAASGAYAMRFASDIPQESLRRYCLRGIGPRAGTFAIDPALGRRVRFAQVNLNEPLPELPEFDAVFLRNVMIYFDADTKAAVVERVVRRVKPGGFLFIGHSESLGCAFPQLQPVATAVYRRMR
jgi:chemotaxis protein methyltransferase CheR